jgi:hypothetical protein
LPWNTTIVLGTLIIIMLLLGRLFLHQSWMCCSVNFVQQRLVQKEQHPNLGTWWKWCKNARWIYVQEITLTSVKWFMTNCCAEFKCKIMAHLHLCVEHVFCSLTQICRYQLLIQFCYVLLLIFLIVCEKKIKAKRKPTERSFRQDIELQLQKEQATWVRMVMTCATWSNSSI